MSRTVRGAVLLMGLSMAACGRTPSPAFTAPTGSRALSRDDVFVYVVDTDRERLRVIDSASERTVAEVPVGRAPERVAVGPDDTVYVTNRGSRSVSVIRKGRWTEAARVTAGIEPVALAVSRDGGTLFVLNSSSMTASDVGTLTAVDTRSLDVKWDVPVGTEPRDLTLLEDGDALISLQRRGEAVRVDLEKPQSPRVLSRAGAAPAPGLAAK